MNTSMWTVLLVVAAAMALPPSVTVAAAEPGFSTADRAVVDKLLTTTRTVRRRLDLSRPVPPEIIEEAIEIAFQAPTGSNRQGWHFIVVTDPAKKKVIADAYRRGMAAYAGAPRPEYDPDDLRVKQGIRIGASAVHLAQHMHEVPALVIAAIEGRVEHQPMAGQA